MSTHIGNINLVAHLLDTSWLQHLCFEKLRKRNDHTAGYCLLSRAVKLSSSAFHDRVVYLPCQVSSQSFYRKSDYSNCNFLNWLAAITQFKNGRDTILRPQSRGSDVKYSKRAHFCMQGDRGEGSRAHAYEPSHMRDTLTPCMRKQERVEYMASLPLDPKSKICVAESQL